MCQSTTTKYSVLRLRPSSPARIQTSVRVTICQDGLTSLQNHLHLVPYPVHPRRGCLPSFAHRPSCYTNSTLLVPQLPPCQQSHESPIVPCTKLRSDLILTCSPSQPHQVYFVCKIVTIFLLHLTAARITIRGTSVLRRLYGVVFPA